MFEHYFTKTNRETVQAVGLEYGQLGGKYVVKTYEGEENPNGLFLHKFIFPREEVLMMNKGCKIRFWMQGKKLSEERLILETKNQ